MAKQNKTPAEQAVDQKDEIFVPSKTLSPQTRAAMAEAGDERRRRTTAETFYPVKNESWKRQERLWSEASPDDRKSYLYDMVLRRGYVMGRKNTLQRVCRYFRIKSEEITEEYLDIMWMADEARVSMIDENIITGFLISDKDSGGKYHLNNTYAYKVQNPAWEGVDSVEQRPTQIIYNEAKADNTELRKEVDALVEKRNAEVNKTKLTAVK